MRLWAATVLEEAGNRLLRLDPRAAERLAELDGKVIELTLTDADGAPAATLYVLPGHSGVRLCRQHDGPADVSLRGSAAALAGMVMGRTPVAPGLQLSGDLELGQRVQRILRELDLDWEEALAERLGDVAAHQLARAVRAASAWGGHAAATLAQDTSEYLRYEAELVVSRERLETFLAAVDRLRADVDRLEKRIERLQVRR